MEDEAVKDAGEEIVEALNTLADVIGALGVE